MIRIPSVEKNSASGREIETKRNTCKNGGGLQPMIEFLNQMFPVDLCEV